MFKTIHECNLELVSHGGTDFMPCSAARVSFGNEDKTGQDVDKDVKLMHYLAKHQHMTPFEHQSATFLVEVPLFIRSQIMRHRTFAYNEISRRYTDENLEFWLPTIVRGQAKNNRQASSDDIIESLLPDSEDGQAAPTIGVFTGSVISSIENYNSLVLAGVAREQARAVLPQSLLTKFYMTGNLRNWCHFLSLRLDSHAQYEVQVVAKRIEAELTKLWPNSMAALMEHQ